MRKSEQINNYIKDLEALNAHKESILAILAHDLRSPLARITAIAGHFWTNYDQIGPTEAKIMLKYIYESSTDELNSLDYLVEWARVKYAAETYSPIRIDLRLYLMKVVDTLYLAADANNIRLRNRIAENTMAYADGKMIISIFHNLISNAIKYSHKEGQITVTADRKDDKIIVEVNDTGIGMSIEAQKKIFTPQMNVLSKARDVNGGAGIGLLLAKDFTEKNGGKIWLESEEGIGTSFYFSVPVEKPLYEMKNNISIKSGRKSA